MVWYRKGVIYNMKKILLVIFIVLVIGGVYFFVNKSTGFSDSRINILQGLNVSDKKVNACEMYGKVKESIAQGILTAQEMTTTTFDNLKVSEYVTAITAQVTETKQFLSEKWQETTKNKTVEDTTSYIFYNANDIRNSTFKFTSYTDSTLNPSEMDFTRGTIAYSSAEGTYAEQLFNCDNLVDFNLLQNIFYKWDSTGIYKCDRLLKTKKDTEVPANALEITWALSAFTNGKYQSSVITNVASNLGKDVDIFVLDNEKVIFTYAEGVLTRIVLPDRNRVYLIGSVSSTNIVEMDITKFR